MNKWIWRIKRIYQTETGGKWEEPNEKLGIYKNKNTGNFESKISHLFDDFESTYEISSLCAMTYNSIIAFFDETCKKEYSTIETVFNYIKNNYSKPVTLDDILKES